ncbi:SpoIIE family protein phosphatase [Paenibacillus sp. GYB003]|uniref:SpoIIE family protein phosphatase n=1 Tax=Paenibacillus sp. GYB003 TaxID=2994392 RepID=UPI002F962541
MSEETVVSDRAAVRSHTLYDTGVAKVSAFAAALLVVSIVVTGAIAYAITKGQSVKKLKENDLVYIAGSIAAKIDGSIERAAETSRLLAEDREIIEWIRQGEKQDAGGASALAKIAVLKQKLGYDSSFIVSIPTGRYYAENGEIIDVMSRGDPDDSWYFQFLQDNKPLNLEIDYNEERRDTFVFINALMKSGGEPLAIVGVGLSLNDLSAKFQEYKYGQNGSLWLIDDEGTIFLSDELAQNGKNIRDFMPASAAVLVAVPDAGSQNVLEFKGADGRTNDLVSFRVPSTEWTLVVSVDRDEAISYLRTIQGQTAAAVAVSLIFVVFIFYYTSRKLAEPYKRAIRLNMELENQISARTRQLAEQNEKMMDSLDYAGRIQQSSLPSEAELREAFPDHFVLWKPKDVVGGDFYWIKRVREGWLVAVGDCTGHGVPGAFMSIMAVSLLNQIAERDGAADCDPSRLLSELDRSVKQTLHQRGNGGLTDDGVDIGLCLITPRQTVFTGAKFTLYVRTAEGLREIEGSRKSVGYRNTPSDYAFASAAIPTKTGDELYLLSDGLTDQNGGDKNYSFGKSRWRLWLESSKDASMDERKRLLDEELRAYMGTEPQRDDITVFGFRLP